MRSRPHLTAALYSSALAELRERHREEFDEIYTEKKGMQCAS